MSSFISIVSGIQAAQSIIRELVAMAQQAQAEGTMTEEELQAIKARAMERAVGSDAAWDAAVAAAKQRLEQDT